MADDEPNDSPAVSIPYAAVLPLKPDPWLRRMMIAVGAWHILYFVAFAIYHRDLPAFLQVAGGPGLGWTNADNLEFAIMAGVATLSAGLGVALIAARRAGTTAVVLATFLLIAIAMEWGFVLLTTFSFFGPSKAAAAHLDSAFGTLLGLVVAVVLLLNATASRGDAAQPWAWAFRLGRWLGLALLVRCAIGLIGFVEPPVPEWIDPRNAVRQTLFHAHPQRLLEAIAGVVAASALSLRPGADVTRRAAIGGNALVAGAILYAIDLGIRDYSWDYLAIAFVSCCALLIPVVLLFWGWRDLPKPDASGDELAR